MSDNHTTGLSHARVETSNFLMIVLILIAVAAIDYVSGQLRFGLIGRKASAPR